MARQETSRYKLSYGWLRGEDWWGDPVSDNFVRTDLLLHPFALSITEPAPPLGVTIGDTFLVPPGGNGAWLGHDNDLAIITEFGWVFCTPQRGVRIGVLDLDWYWFDGVQWVPEGAISGTPPALLGIRYDIAVSVGYEADPLEVLLAFTIPEAMTWPNLAPASVGRSLTAPLSILRLGVQRNGADVGTITFNPGSVQATFSVVGNKAFAAGDLLSVHMPVTPPDGFENYSATLRLTLNNGV